MNKKRLHLLQDIPIFGGVSAQTLEFIIARATYITLEKGQFLFREGEPGETMFVLEEGSVAILKAWRGKDYLLGKLGTGDCVGEMSLFDLNPRSASVAALSHCEAIVISHNLFYELHKQDIYQYALIQLNISREVCRRLRDADQQLFRAKLEADLINGEYVFHI